MSFFFCLSKVVKVDICVTKDRNNEPKNTQEKHQLVYPVQKLVGLMSIGWLLELSQVNKSFCLNFVEAHKLKLA